MATKNRKFRVEQLNTMGGSIKTWEITNYRFVNKGLMIYFVDPATDDGVFIGVHNVMIHEITEQKKGK